MQSAAETSDDGLVRAMAAGDRGAFAAFYDRFAQALAGLARRFFRDEREAEDLLHDVFLEAWRRSAEFDTRRGSCRAWLTSMLRSRALDRLRSAAHTKVVREERPLEVAAAPEADLDEALDSGRVHRALGHLPPAQREVLVLGYFEGLTSSEIARRLSVPVGTVKSRTAAALSKLRQALGGGS